MQSSANSLIVLLHIWSGKSLMYTRNNRGPRTVPCGTPEDTGIEEEQTPFRTTCWDLFSKNWPIHWCTLPWIPYHWSLYSSLWCGTVSKALAKSRQLFGRISFLLWLHIFVHTKWQTFTVLVQCPVLCLRSILTLVSSWHKRSHLSTLLWLQFSRQLWHDKRNIGWVQLQQTILMSYGFLKIFNALYLSNNPSIYYHITCNITCE